MKIGSAFSGRKESYYSRLLQAGLPAVRIISLSLGYKVLRGWYSLGVEQGL